MLDRILFRVDANQNIGYGHLVRCISIANALSNLEVVFVSTDHMDTYIKSQIRTPFKFILLNNTDDFFELLIPNDIVIIDGYQFDVNYHKKLKDLRIKHICIDDLAQQELFADIVINPTPSIDPSEYKTPIFTQFCIGLNYALLRPSFLELAKQSNIPKKKGSLLICFGGSDPLNKTKNALEAANLSDYFNEIQVVLGPAYQFFETLEPLVKSNPNVHVHSNLNEEKMVELMRICEHAILPSSGILLEGLAAKMKIISGFYVDNQKIVYKNHLKLKSFVDASDFSIDAIQKAFGELKEYELLKSSIDGYSLIRVTKVISQLCLENTCEVRKATIKDANFTFDWANNPETRKYAFNKSVILFEDHIKWFTQKIQSNSCAYYILEMESKPVGSIRFDITDNVALISYLIDPSYFGKGLGTICMKLGLKALSEEYSTNEILEVKGYVFKENIASILTFRKFGFKQFAENDSFLFTKKFKSNV